MKRNTTHKAATPHAIVEDAWEAVGASFDLTWTVGGERTGNEWM